MLPMEAQLPYDDTGSSGAACILLCSISRDMRSATCSMECCIKTSIDQISMFPNEPRGAIGSLLGGLALLQASLCKLLG